MSTKFGLEKGNQCWISDKENGWLLSKILNIEKENSKCILEIANDNSPRGISYSKISSIDEINLKNENDDIEDLTKMVYLNEPSILNSIKTRYARSAIYTYSGIALISVNPFQKMKELYSAHQCEKYRSKSKTERPPHIFAISEDAYSFMIEQNMNQSIIISGESGAGKTMSVKYIMRYLASVDSGLKKSSLSDIEGKILAANPILEAFGNAKTSMNDNSSRFGKYLKILFNKKNEICGVSVKTYLLERSRLVSQQNGERNYHIFYGLIKCVDGHIKKKLGLSNFQDFQYLKSGGISQVGTTDDIHDFIKTCNCLKLIGIDSEKQMEIFKILAALLHIGNIQIHNSRNEATILSHDLSLIKACSLLGLEDKVFTKWIVKNQIQTKTDKIVSNRKYHEAISARDSIAKYIYSSLFDWLVQYMNSALCPQSYKEDVTRFIGVLDIYGFEHFETNSFEQLCINYANEKLHQEFMRRFFKLRQIDYVEEGIDWSFIDFIDNQTCIDVFEQKLGLLSLLDEESMLMTGSNASWAQKLVQALGKAPYNEVFRKGKFGYDSFIIKHFASDVSYQVEGFVEKNRNDVSDVHLEMLKQSKNDFLLQVLSTEEGLPNSCPCSSRTVPTSRCSHSLYSVSSSHAMNSENYHKVNCFSYFDSVHPSSCRHSHHPNSARNKKPTLALIFKNSLISLTQTINSTNTHYIRCIKPNEERIPWKFDSLKVLSQLRACGVLETIKMANACFQSDLTYNVFVNKYAILLPLDDYKSYLKNLNPQTEGLAKKILQDVPGNLYKTGNTKVFLKRGALSYIEKIKLFKIKRAATLIQSKCRSFLSLIRDAKEQKQSLQNDENRSLGNIAVSTHIGFISVALYLFLRNVL